MIVTKTVNRKKVPNNLVCYDTPFKLYTTFYSLAFKYFSFKIFEEGVRKNEVQRLPTPFCAKGRCNLYTLP